MENTPADVSTSEINNFLTRRLGEKEASEVMQYINSEIDKRVAAQVNETRTEIGKWRDNLHNDFATKKDAELLQQRLVNRVSKVESTLILWGIVFWITLLIAVYCFLRFF